MIRDLQSLKNIQTGGFDINNIDVADTILIAYAKSNVLNICNSVELNNQQKAFLYLIRTLDGVQDIDLYLNQNNLSNAKDKIKHI